MEKGAVVWLKSGGPAMTVKVDISRKEWICTWFTPQSEIREHTFFVEQLTDKDPNSYLSSFDDFDELEDDDDIDDSILRKN